MLRFVFIFLLTTLALNQVASSLGLVPGFVTAELCSLSDEGDDDIGSTPEVKEDSEDKFYNTTGGMFSVSAARKIDIPLTSDQLYISFFDQPNTPPPDFC